jgi:LMBR1 domain-containing protein 1
MVDVLTLIMTILVTIGLLICNIYLLAYYCHPDDKETCIGWVAKIFVVLGLTLAWSQVLLLPLDVSNNRTFGGGLNMKVFWFIVYVLTAIYILIIFPLVSGFYESDEDWTFCEKFKHSLCCFFVMLFCFFLLSIILYVTIGKAKVPININCVSIGSVYTYEEKTKIEIKVSYITYILAMLSFLSWILFAVFGGIGMAAVPLDFFHDFCTRPKSINSEDIKTRKEILLSNLGKLQELGKDVQHMEKEGYDKLFIFNSKRRKYNKKLHAFKAGTLLAEEEFYICNLSEEIKKKNNCVIIFYYLLIPLGVLSLIATILWIIQFICTYFFTKDGGERSGYPFLSYLFIYFQDHDVAFLSFIFFSLLALYLLFTVIKGNIKFGVRFLFCWTIYPMKKDETYMNAFLFNVSLILLASISVTQFCADCLRDYVAFTDIDLLFNIQIKYLKFFIIFYKYHIFQYVWFGIFILSCIYLLCRPRDRMQPIIDGGRISDEKRRQEMSNLLNKNDKTNNSKGSSD